MIVDQVGVSTFEYIFHISEIVVAAPVAWQVIRAANRIIDVLKDFPPHRHVNGKIIYPKGYTPPEVDTIQGGK